MIKEKEMILIGTGVAPLVAASRLMANGVSCVILNPDSDFFLEDSELPLNPLFPLDQVQKQQHRTLKASRLDDVLKKLQPDFPGTLEFWSPYRERPAGFHDENAPHVRARTRLFLKSPQDPESWAQIEELFLHAQELGLHSSVLEGPSAIHRFPGFNGSLSGHHRAISIGDLYDLDITRYRNELLEYIRERLGSESIQCGAGFIDWITDGLRFYQNSQIHTYKASRGILLFWTPRLINWLRGLPVSSTPMPKGLRLWEEWSIHSREFIDPSVIGVYKGLFVYSDYEGNPPRDALARNVLKILKPSVLFSWTPNGQLPRHLPYASSETLTQLTEFCENFLDWERFSISGMNPRVIFEWNDLHSPAPVPKNPKMELVVGVDGPMDQVVSQTLDAVERWM